VIFDAASFPPTGSTVRTRRNQAAINTRMVRLSRHLGTPPNVEPELGIKRVFLRRFPFSVYFIEHDDRFRVLAVAHRRRLPFYWRDRL